MFAAFKATLFAWQPRPKIGPAPSLPPSPATTPTPTEVGSPSAGDSPPTEAASEGSPAQVGEEQEQLYQPKVAEVGAPFDVDISRWAQLEWCSLEDLRKFATCDLGLVLGLVQERYEGKLIAYVQSQEPLMTELIGCFPTQAQLREFDSVRPGDVKGVVELIEAMVALRRPHITVQVVASLRGLGDMLKEALLDASLQPAGRWLMHPLGRVNYYVVPLLLLLSVQRFHDATPPDVLKELGRGADTIMQCLATDGDVQCATHYSLLNLNNQGLNTIFAQSPPLQSQLGLSAAELTSVYLTMGHAIAIMLGWLVWCPRCRKWIWLWNTTGRKRSDGRSAHQAIVNNPIELSLSLIYTIIKGHTMIASRKGHDEVSVTKRLGKGGIGRSLKPQVFATALRTANGVAYLGYTLRTEATEQLLTVSISDDPLARAESFDKGLQDIGATSKQREEQRENVMVVAPTALHFVVFPSHIAMARINCWSPIMDGVFETEDQLVPLVLASLSTSAAIPAEDGVYRYCEIPMQVEQELDYYWGQQRAFWITMKHLTKARAKDKQLLSAKEEVGETDGDEDIDAFVPSAEEVAAI